VEEADTEAVAADTEAGTDIELRHGERRLIMQYLSG
jgi:hypothetical protein